MQCAMEERCTSDAMLYLSAYVFLLRVPSECLPMRKGSGLFGSEGYSHKSVICVNDSEVVLHLSSRKNRPKGSRLIRKCWCAACPDTCPVHVLGKFFNGLADGCQPFVHTTPHVLLRVLRSRLASLAVEEAHLYIFRTISVVGMHVTCKPAVLVYMKSFKLASGQVPHSCNTLM